MPSRRLFLLLALAPACAPDQGPEIVAHRNGPILDVAVDGDDVYVLDDNVVVVDRVADRTSVLGEFGDDGAGDLAAGDGAVTWIHRSSYTVFRLVDGEVQRFDVEATELHRDGACAVFTTILDGLWRLCPEDEAPTLLAAEATEPFAVADDGYYYMSEGYHLTRLDRGGVRTDHGRPVYPSAIAVEDGVPYFLSFDLSVWRMVDGTPELLGTLPTRDDPEAELSVIDGSVYYGPARLPAGSAQGELWLPDAPAHDHVVRDGVAAWVEDRAEGSFVYLQPVD